MNAPDARFCANPQCTAQLSRPTELGAAGEQDRTTQVAQVPVSAAPAPQALAPPAPAPQAPAPRLPPIEPQVPNLYRPDGPGQRPDGPGQRPGVRVSLEPTTLRVEPGQSGTVTVTVTNTGSQAARFGLRLAGAAAEFATIDPAVLQIPARDRRTARVSFRPRRDSAAPAGWAQYTVHAQAGPPGGVSGTAPGTVDVAPFTAIAGELDPPVTRGRAEGAPVLTLVNEGNTTTRVQVSFRDRDGVVRVRPDSPFATMYPADVVDIPLTVSAPRRVIGRPAGHPFQAVIEAPGLSQPVVVGGVRQQVPLVPWWAPVAVTAIAALVIGLLTLFGGPSVPGTRLLSELEATARLEQAGYQVDARRLSDPVVPAGAVIGTEPAAGTELDKGSVVVLMVSTGPPVGNPEIPVVAGLGVDAAAALLEQAGFEVRVVQRSDESVARGLAIGTSPPAGSAHPAGSEVLLAISSGGTAKLVPELAGESERDATTQLDALGIRWEIVNEFNDGTRAGTVIRTEPGAGQSIPADGAVTLFVSQGQRPDLVMSLLTSNCVLHTPDETGLYTLELNFEMTVNGSVPGEVAVRVATKFGDEDTVVPATGGAYQAFVHLQDAAFDDPSPFLGVDVFIDPHDDVREANENNNFAGLAVDLPKPPPGTPVSVGCDTGGA